MDLILWSHVSRAARPPTVRGRSAPADAARDWIEAAAAQPCDPSTVSTGMRSKPDESRVMLDSRICAYYGATTIRLWAEVRE